MQRGMVAMLAAALALLAGFAWFLAHLSHAEQPLTVKADGIVVLTGGASRVADGLELLAAGNGQRLLISGVHPASTTTDIARTLPEFQRLVVCCVDLDHEARNTRGNAIGARRWVDARRFKSLIVVTSNYHMPRALTEFAHFMPNVTLTAYPVVGERWKAEPWWANGGTLRLAFSEYVKYALARARVWLADLGLYPGDDAAAVTAFRAGTADALTTSSIGTGPGHQRPAR